MTSIVGIVCSDGVVIGSDSAATFSSSGFRTIEQETKKIEIINGIVIVAGTGEMGLGQRFCNIANKFFKNPETIKNGKPTELMTSLAENTIKDFRSTYTAFPQFGQQGFNFGGLVAYTTGDKFYLCEFDPIHFRPELKFPKQNFVFCSMGCGQPITDPFLGLMRKVFWNSCEPSVAEAKFITAWTLQHAIYLNPGGINSPIQMAAVRKNQKGRYSAVMISDEEIQEHMDNIAGAEHYLSKYRDIHRGVQSEEKIPEMNDEKL